MSNPTPFQRRLASIASGATAKQFRCGSEGDSVGMKEVRLAAQGRVRNPQGFYIAVVESLL